MFWCSYTIFREFKGVLAKVINYYNDKIQYVLVFYGNILVNAAA